MAADGPRFSRVADAAVAQFDRGRGCAEAMVPALAPDGERPPADAQRTAAAEELAEREPARE